MGERYTLNRTERPAARSAGGLSSYLSVVLPLAFLLSRLSDITMTALYSEGLRYEGNPLIVYAERPLVTVAVTQVIIVLVFAYFHVSFFRGANKDCSSRASDLAAMVGCTAMGFGVSVEWLLLHRWKVDWAIFDMTMLESTLAHVVILILVPFVVTYLLYVRRCRSSEIQ